MSIDPFDERPLGAKVAGALEEGPLSGQVLADGASWGALQVPGRPGSLCDSSFSSCSFVNDRFEGFGTCPTVQGFVEREPNSASYYSEVEKGDAQPAAQPASGSFAPWHLQPLRVQVSQPQKPPPPLPP